jgi:hypothetical protein
MKKYLVGLVIFLAFFGLLAVLDKFKDNEKFNKASNSIAYVLLFGGFGVVAVCVLIGIYMFIKHEIL